MMEAGYVYLGLGRFKEAKEVFEGVSALTPKSEVPLVALGSIYFAQAQFAKAIQCYEKALHLNDKSSFAHAYMGEALYFSGKKQEALESLKRGVDLDPTGQSGGFANALLDAIQKGYQPAFGPDAKKA